MIRIRDTSNSSDTDFQNASPDQLLEELGETLSRAINLLSDLDQREPTRRESDGSLMARIERYRQQLDSEREDRTVLTEQLIDAERQATNVMSLYVATHQLHATLDPQDVYAAIGEIATDLLGARSFALVLKEEAEGDRIALTRGLDGEVVELFDGDTYSGGDPAIDKALEDGILHINDNGSTGAIAVVPLRVDTGHMGVLAIFEVFAHKTDSLRQDRDLLDLLSAHAGSALVAAESYSKTDRKLQTLKNLVSLLPAG